MFDLPIDADPSTPHVITIDEPANTLSRMIEAMYGDHYKHLPPSKIDFKLLYDMMKIHDKYDTQIIRQQVEQDWAVALASDPFGGFTFASHIDDLELGKKAIKLMKLDPGQYYSLDINIWEAMSHAKPTWQLELAKLIMSLEVGIGDKFSVKVRTNTSTIAARFNPQ
jgi:hypothetical protein